MLEQPRQGHAGTARMGALGRMYFYRPGMSIDIEHVVRSHVNCAQAAANPVKVPLTP